MNAREGYCPVCGLVHVHKKSRSWVTLVLIAVLAFITCGVGAILFVPFLGNGPTTCKACGGPARAFEV